MIYPGWRWLIPPVDPWVGTPLVVDPYNPPTSIPFAWFGCA